MNNEMKYPGMLNVIVKEVVIFNEWNDKSENINGNCYTKMWSVENKKLKMSNFNCCIVVCRGVKEDERCSSSLPALRQQSD